MSGFFVTGNPYWSVNGHTLYPTDPTQWLVLTCAGILFDCPTIQSPGNPSIDWGDGRIEDAGSITLSPLGGGADDGPQIVAALLTGKAVWLSPGVWNRGGTIYTYSTAVLASATTQQPLVASQSFPYRGIDSIVDSLVPVSALGATVALRKLAGDAAVGCYCWEALAQCGTDARDWAGWRFDTKHNPGTIGQVRLYQVRHARLYGGTTYTLAKGSAARTPPGAWDDWDPTWGGPISGVVYCTGNAGEVVTYTAVVPAGGSILLEWMGLATAGIAWIVIRDHLGAEIAAGRYDLALVGGHRELDMRQVGAGSYELYVTSLASALAADTYTVEVTASNTHSGGPAGVSIHDRRCFAANVGVAGDPATDPFLYVTTHPTLITNGQQESGWYFRKATSIDVMDREYCGGLHGYEKKVTGLTVKIDGVEEAGHFTSDLTYYDTRWTGTTLTWGFVCIGTTRVAPADAITETWTCSFDRSGYTATVARAAIIDLKMTQESLGMLVVDNTPYSGFERIAIDCSPKRVYTLGHVTPALSINLTPPTNRGGCAFDDHYAVAVTLAEPEELATHYADTEGWDQLVDASTGVVKLYHYRVWQKAATDYEIATGDSVSYTAKWRVAYAAGGGFAAALA